MPLLGISLHVMKYRKHLILVFGNKIMSWISTFVVIAETSASCFTKKKIFPLNFTVSLHCTECDYLLKLKSGLSLLDGSILLCIIFSHKSK